MFLRTIHARSPSWRSLGRRVGQSFPSKPVRVIVTFPPGGTPDIYGRVMSAELQKVWNQSVVVENRTGAGGTIGTDLRRRRRPDGYTCSSRRTRPITIAPPCIRSCLRPGARPAPIVNVAGGPTC